MTGKPAVLVDIASATHGRPWELEDRCILAINRAHSDLVKFSKQDEDYEVVLHHLRRFSSVSASVIRDRFKANSASSRFSTLKLYSIILITDLLASLPVLMQDMQG